MRAEVKSPCALKLKIESIVSGGSRCAPVEQVVDPKFELLNIAVVRGERIAGKDRGRGWNGESPVAQSEIIVLHLNRPIHSRSSFIARPAAPTRHIIRPGSGSRSSGASST